MNIIRMIFLILTLIFPLGVTYAKDTVTSHITLDFDKSRYKSVDPAATIPPGKIVKLWGWLKLVSEGNIEAETYYLEWEYKDGEKIENLGNYNTNKKYLEYTRKTDREEAYYWVSKRVWSQAKGEYIFRVYIKENNEYKLIRQSTVAVGE